MDLSKYNTSDIDDLYKMNKDNIELFSDCIANAFKGYPLFEHMGKYNYDIDKMKQFWRIMLKANKKNSLCLSSDPNVKSVCLCFKPGYKGPSFISYIANSGISLIRKFGLRSVIDIAKFEKQANKIKSSHSSDNCWYVYVFATHPNNQGLGIGSKMFKKILKFFDKNNQDCYLETLDKKNVDIYKHFGFNLKQIEECKIGNMKIYAMLRNSQNNKASDQNKTDSLTELEM